MDAARFDSLTKQLSHSRTRRRLLGWLFGSAAILPLVDLFEPGGDPAAAAPTGCKALGKTCTKANQCCPETVCAGGRCAAPTPTPPSTCTADGDACTSTATCGPAGGDCFCVTAAGSGSNVCLLFFSCQACAGDADCAFIEAGMACVQAEGCCAEGTGCARRC